MRTLQVMLHVPDESDHYLESSARLRGISRPALLRRIVDTVLRDQLILGVLDDERSTRSSAPRPKTGSAGRNMPPQTNLYRGLVSAR